ncbi:unnamed protein product [Cylicocyclus nassatus]|uniref:C2 domain-containing protein n=1 Tax=Cylicocyclus nassatus TaxID=53992 RepID=A0AA36GSH6_CYLNA|nr:unnamed protein product [Cylicocyclus nassatus]
MLAVLILLPATLAESFWITAELLRVDWKEGCLTTAGCSQPRFKILEDMLPNSERISISWPVSEHFVQVGNHQCNQINIAMVQLARMFYIVTPSMRQLCELVQLVSQSTFAQDASRPFVSYWENGNPQDVTLSCQIVGSDPTYGFPRVCDQTPSIRVFQDEVIKVLGRDRRHQDLTTIAIPDEELGKRLIEARAKCFNATIAAQKHIERCPWCPDPSHALFEQELPEDAPAPALSTSILAQLQEDEILRVSVLVLAVIAVSVSLGFACALVAFLQQKSTYRRSVKPRYRPFSPSTCKVAEDENRYDMPWGYTRPFTHWPCSSSKSEATTTSPLDSTSSIAAPYSFRSGFTIPQTHLYQHISPNSSIGPVHDS